MMFERSAYDIAGYPSRKSLPDMRGFLKSIEESPSKDDFKVGLEAR